MINATVTISTVTLRDAVLSGGDESDAVVFDEHVDAYIASLAEHLSVSGIKIEVTTEQFAGVSYRVSAEDWEYADECHAAIQAAESFWDWFN